MIKNQTKNLTSLTAKSLQNHLWHLFQLQDDFYGASGRVHDWHRTIVEVLLYFNIWFNSAASGIVYLFTTARDQWATVHERRCILSSLSAVKGCALSGLLKSSGCFSLWECGKNDSSTSSWDELEFEHLNLNSALPPAQSKGVDSITSSPNLPFSVLKCSVLKHFSSCLVGSKWVLHFSQAKNLS